MAVVIISEREDLHISPVAKYLHKQPIIIDTQDIINGTELSYAFIHGELHVFYEGRALDNVTGVWVRRPRNGQPILDEQVRKLYRHYAGSAMSHFMSMLYATFPEATWISDPYAIKRANHKSYQQVVASRLGFNVPNTLYTSNPSRAKAFVQACERAVTKTLSSNHPTLDQRRILAFYTKKVPEQLDYQGLRLAPAIFQAAITPTKEFRVTVVGDQIFTARISVTAKGRDTGVRDWRIMYLPEKGSMALTPYDLPEEIAQQCVSLVRELGLAYGAIDLMEDEQGKVWFLEINPNGQWLFAEEATGHPIGKTLATMLESGAPGRTTGLA